MAELSDNSPESITAVVARARLLMLISAATTLIAIAAVVGVIGYRVFEAGGSAAPPAADGVVALPKGARVLSTAASAGRIGVLIELDGGTELRIFDIKTLRQTGRVRFMVEP